MAATNYTVLREFVDYRRNIRFRPGMTFAGDSAQADTVDFLANGWIGPFVAADANVAISASAPYPATR
jgi:hypothetical protein